MHKGWVFVLAEHVEVVNYCDQPRGLFCLMTYLGRHIPSQKGTGAVSLYTLVSKYYFRFDAAACSTYACKTRGRKKKLSE